MIRLEVEPYCQECQDFEADVESPECNLYFGQNEKFSQNEQISCLIIVQNTNSRERKFFEIPS